MLRLGFKVLTTLVKCLYILPLLFLISCVSLIKERIISPEQIGDEVIFRLDSPSATVVTVAGEFNGWEYRPDQARVIKMKKVSDTLWEVSLKVPKDIAPGRYQYKFVIDYATWILDPYNPHTVDDGRGNINSLLIVK